MSGSGPGDDDPFQGIPFLGEFAKMLQGQGPIHWDAARQFALMVATEGVSPPNIDPAVRFQWADLARIAELHVQAATGLDTAVDGRVIEVVPVTEATWAQRSLDAYRPLFERLAGSLGTKAPRPGEGDDLPVEADEMPAMFGNLLAAPVTGDARHGRRLDGRPPRPPRLRPVRPPDPPAPLARADGREQHRRPVRARTGACPATTCACGSACRSSRPTPCCRCPTSAQALERLLAEYVAGFQPNPHALEEALGSIDPSRMGDQAALQEAMGDPTVLLGAIESPAQRALLPRLDAIVAVVIGYVDHTLDEIGRGLVGSAGDDRRGGAAPARGGRRVRRLRRAPARAHAHQGPGRAGQRLRGRRAGAGRRRGPGAACGIRPPSCPRRPRWTPRVSGSPASTSDVGLATSTLRSPRPSLAATRAAVDVPSTSAGPEPVPHAFTVAGRAAPSGVRRRGRGLVPPAWAGRSRRRLWRNRPTRLPIGSGRRPRPRTVRIPTVYQTAPASATTPTSRKPTAAGIEMATGTNAASTQLSWKRVSNWAKARPWLASGASCWTVASKPSRAMAALKPTDTRQQRGASACRRRGRRPAPRPR